MNNTVSKITAKPFLKWAGGKGQLLERFHEIYPKELVGGEIENYYEPFLGGGAVFLDVIQKYKIKNAWLFDINPELILCYQVIQNNVAELIQILDEYQQQYLSLEQEGRNEFFYTVRDTFNQKRLKIKYNCYSKGWIERAAQIIFLNKTCFNGLFRFNKKGAFNTPVGRYKNPTISNAGNLQNVSKQLQNVHIECTPYKEVLKHIKPKAFVYFDPPYRPLNANSNFTAYSKHSFTDVDQRELADVFKTLSKKGAKVMLSNSDPKNSDPMDNFFDDLYQDFNMSRIPARRQINSKSGKRGVVNEIVVTSY